MGGDFEITLANTGAIPTGMGPSFTVSVCISIAGGEVNLSGRLSLTVFAGQATVRFLLEGHCLARLSPLYFPLVPWDRPQESLQDYFEK
jgi:hypothetical protein